MTLEEEQKVLLKIVETWQLSEKPEYRGFRCANCQKYKNEAWYHWIQYGGYKLPLHMCDDTCHQAFLNNTIQVDEKKRQNIDRQTFGTSYTYNPEAMQQFREIVSAWPEHKEPELKSFTCDACQKELDIDATDGMRKGYHAWWSYVAEGSEEGTKMDDGITLAELHFHKECAALLGITD